MATVRFLLLTEDDAAYGRKVDKHSTIMQTDFADRSDIHNVYIKILLVFLSASAVSVFFYPANAFIQQNSWMVGASFFATMTILTVLHFKRREDPTNLILLRKLPNKNGQYSHKYYDKIIMFIYIKLSFLSILIHAYASAATVFDVNLILQTIFIAVVMIIGLIVYTFRLKNGFMFIKFRFFIASLMAFFAGGIVNIYTQWTAIELVLSIVGVSLFILVTTCDTHMLMYTLTLKEFLFGVINIYLNIINLLVHIQQVLAAAKR